MACASDAHTGGWEDRPAPMDSWNRCVRFLLDTSHGPPLFPKSLLSSYGCTMSPSQYAKRPDWAAGKRPYAQWQRRKACGSALPESNLSTSMAVLGRLSGHTLTFMGDSITRQQFIAVVCFVAVPLIREHGRSSRPAEHQEFRRNITFSSERFEMEPKKNVHDICARINVRRCVTFRDQESAAICYTPAGTDYSQVDSACGTIGRKYPDGHPHVPSGPTITGMQARGWLRRGDLLVPTFGHHYHDTMRLQQELRDLLTTVAALPTTARPRLLWHEVSPEHFPTQGGLWFKENTFSGSRNACAPIALAQLGTATLPLRWARPLLDQARVPVLDTFMPSVIRWMEHSKPGKDCTHWCMPSSVLDLSAAMLQEWLMA